MERTQLIDLMGELELYGIKAAFDEVMATAVKREHEPQRIVGDLPKAEISEKQARSIKYQLTIPKHPKVCSLAIPAGPSTSLQNFGVMAQRRRGFLHQTDPDASSNAASFASSPISRPPSTAPSPRQTQIQRLSSGLQIPNASSPLSDEGRKR
jgi:hypothetical protein